MGKKSRTKSAAAAKPGEVGPRQQCPCGSGRRYKACHGSADGGTPYVVRTFEGLPGECDWVAMREFLPVGKAALTLRPGAYDGAADGRSVTVVTVLPGIAPASVRADGDIWLAVQVAHQSGDPSRDFAEALHLALAAEPGDSVVMPSLPGVGPRLQDVVEAGSKLEVTVLDGYDFWFEDSDDSDASVAATLEQLNSSVDPSTRLTSVDAAYWTSVGTKEHLRWVLPHDEDAALTALARLHAADADRVGEESRLVGSFRAHGLLVPVWDLPVGTGAAALEAPAAALAARLGEALETVESLTVDERSARNGLANRQLTIR
ncbi:MAG: SEC-C domain-containing protein [Nocardioidaceae bacterium]|nr:SEC-C domain-containing protein [Nocardioidaceae bacterium]